jgi:8-oxo-dGTP diphosphatase
MIRVSCAIIKDGNKIFAAQRGPDAQQALKWEFPGGKVEPGESDEECLKRELMEELEMQVKLEKRLPSVTYAYPSFSIELIPFVCSLQNKDHFANEHSGTGWFTREQLLQLDWAAADVAVMHYVIEKVF